MKQVKQLGYASAGSTDAPLLSFLSFLLSTQTFFLGRRGKFKCATEFVRWFLGFVHFGTQSKKSPLDVSDGSMFIKFLNLFINYNVFILKKSFF